LIAGLGLVVLESFISGICGVAEIFSILNNLA